MSKNTNLSFLTDFLTADIVNSRVGMNNVSPQATFDVTGTGKFSGILTLGSTVSNGTYTYTLPSATGTLALTSDIPSVTGYVPYTGANQSVDLGYNSLAASFLRVNGAGPTLGSYLGFKHSTNVTTGADGYTSIYTFGTNTIAFKSISGATTRDFSFSMASITPGVAGGRTYTLPDADGTIALTSSLSGYLPLTGGTLTGPLNGTSASFTGSGSFISTANTYAGGALILRQLGGTNPIYLTSVSGLFALSNGGGADHLLISSTGAATFSSSVTAGSSSATNYATLQIMGAMTSPSLTVGTAANVVFAMAAGQELAITANGTAPFGVNFQARNSLAGGGPSGTAYPLLFNPLGGNVLIGTTTDAGYKLDVNGTGRFANVVDIQATRTPQLTLLKLSTNTLSSDINDEVSIDFGRGLMSKYSGRISGYISNFSTYDGGLKFYSSTSGTLNATPSLTLASTGAATFSSSVTSQVTNISADGAGVVLQGYVDNILRIAVRGSGYNDGARGGLLASTGDFSGTIYAATLSQFGSAVAGQNVQLNINGVSGKAQRIEFQNSGVQQWLMGAGAASETSAFEIFNSTGVISLSINKSTNAATFSSSVMALKNFISESSTDSTSIGITSAENAKYNYVAYGGYWGIKTTTTGFNFAVDTYNGGTPKNVLTITQAGNVGIGTASPTNKLEIVGGNTTVGQLSVGNTDVTYSAGVNFLTSGTNRGFVGWRHTNSGAPFNLTGIHLFNTDNSNIVFGTNNLVRAVIDTNGNVGIGITSANGKLFVKQSSANFFDGINNYASSNDSFIGIGHTGSLAVINSTYNSTGVYAPMAFYTSDTERMRITSGGAVLIGTTSTRSTMLNIVNASGLSSITCQVATNGDNAINWINASSTYICSIVVNASSVSYNTSSDYRLKQDLKDFSGLNLVSNIKVYDYEWKIDNTRAYGVVAHELEEIIPQAVSGVKDDILENGEIKSQGVDYSKIVPILIKAIQEQQEQIDKLTNA